MSPTKYTLKQSYFFALLSISIVGAFFVGLGIGNVDLQATDDNVSYITTDKQLRQHMLALGMAMSEHNLKVDPDLLSYLFSFDRATHDMLVIYPNRGDGHSSWSTASDYVKDYGVNYPNGTRYYEERDGDGNVVKTILLRDDPELTFRIFMINETR